MDKTEQEVLDFIGNKQKFKYDGFLFTTDTPIAKVKRFVTNVVRTKECCRGKIVYFDGARTSKKEIANKLKISMPALSAVITGKKSFDINGHHIELKHVR